jgi:hypothetical protein
MKKQTKFSHLSTCFDIFILLPGFDFRCPAKYPSGGGIVKFLTKFTKLYIFNFSISEVVVLVERKKYNCEEEGSMWPCLKSRETIPFKLSQGFS